MERATVAKTTELKFPYREIAPLISVSKIDLIGNICRLAWRDRATNNISLSVGNSIIEIPLIPFLKSREEQITFFSRGTADCACAR